jgi:hypothetical protein
MQANYFMQVPLQAGCFMQVPLEKKLHFRDALPYIASVSDEFRLLRVLL